jgi:D-lactate dehydrogenase (cytochrome)
LLAVAIGGTAFAAGIAYNKSSRQDVDYSRSNKFSAPKYGSVKDMQIVGNSQLV